MTQEQEERPTKPAWQPGQPVTPEMLEEMKASQAAECSDAEFTLVVSTLSVVSTMISRLPLSGAISALSRSETSAMIMDPTLYMKSMRKVQSMDRVLRALRGYQKVVMEEAEKEIKGELR